MHQPAIVISAFNRPHSLQRLLSSLAQAEYLYKDIPLVISIDKSETDNVVQIAESFEWKFGVKHIVKHDAHLGLREHILYCGDLTATYGTVIILEDDLYVSPHFYSYTCQALSFYSQDKNGSRIAGISLFNYEVAENGFGAFEPLPDGSDTYFVQIASSWGQCYTANQWNDFKVWLNTHSQILANENLPSYIIEWNQTSWKKHFVRYLIATERYFVFPRISLTTNFGDVGTNTDRKGLFQSQLLTTKKQFQFSTVCQSGALYDAWFEMNPECFKKAAPMFAEYSLELDLYGTKRNNVIQSSYIISSKTCSQPLSSFGNELRPMLWNIIQQNPGAVFHFAETKCFHDTEIDIEKFYPVVSSVVDIVFYQRINALSEARIQTQLNDSRHRENFRTFGVVLRVQSQSKIVDTLQSVEMQNYPYVQWFIIADNNADIPLDSFSAPSSVTILNSSKHLNVINALKQLTADYFVMLEAGDTFNPEVLHSVNSIFRKYEFIHQLRGLAITAVGVERLPAIRLNRNIFLQKQPQIISSSFFFDRYALNKLAVRDDEHTHYNPQQLFFSLLCNEPVYATPSVFSISKNTRTQSVSEDKQGLGWLDTVLQYFFEKDITYLRYFFAEHQQLPPVVRFEQQTESWYLSRY